MHTNPTPNNPTYTPASGGGYIPYFYESGLYRLYPQPDRNVPGEPTERTYVRYDFTSDLSPARAGSAPQTVEQIIARGYLAIPPAEAELALISDRKDTSWMGLEDFIHQARQRQDLYVRNTDELDQSVCEANNAVFRQEADQGGPANEKQRYSANKMIQKIYEQKRAERVEFWRDLSRLKQSMPEAIQQYLAAYRKVSILQSSEGDFP